MEALIHNYKALAELTEYEVKVLAEKVRAKRMDLNLNGNELFGLIT